MTNVNAVGGPYDEHELDPTGLSDVEYCQEDIKRYMARKEMADYRGDTNIARIAQQGIDFWTRQLKGVEAEGSVMVCGCLGTALTSSGHLRHN